MELKNIFKMEMFKNWSNRPYLIVIAILTAMAAAATFLGVVMIEETFSEKTSTLLIFLIPLIVFFVLGLAAFSILFPFHLLNTDYKNRVISLIFASGVSREKYYFVKISATILAYFIAWFVIWLIPIVTFSFFYDPFDAGNPIQTVIKFFAATFQPLAFLQYWEANVFLTVLSVFLSILSNILILTTSVIITKGKVAGIFLYFGFLFALSTIQSMISLPMLLVGAGLGTFNSDSYTSMMNWGIVSSIVQIAGFALLGLWVLRKQDL
jgi:ABC-type transport system involved in multi-copper enzyme maturation permease subunit